MQSENNQEVEKEEQWFRERRLRTRQADKDGGGHVPAGEWEAFKINVLILLNSWETDWSLTEFSLICLNTGLIAAVSF